MNELLDRLDTLRALGRPRTPSKVFPPIALAGYDAKASGATRMICERWARRDASPS
jgi:hypothetical protein